MENTFNKYTNRTAWAAREHEIKLHERVQHWGEALVPLLEEASEDKDDMLALFEFLMSSVERGDTDIAQGLIDAHEVEMIELTRSWYTGQLGQLAEPIRSNAIRNRFLTLLKLYRAGKDSRVD